MEINPDTIPNKFVSKLAKNGITKFNRSVIKLQQSGSCVNNSNITFVNKQSMYVKIEFTNNKTLFINNCKHASPFIIDTFSADVIVLTRVITIGIISLKQFEHRLLIKLVNACKLMGASGTTWA